MQDTSAKPSTARMLVPLLLSAMAIMYCWWKFLSDKYVPQWQHYVALVTFIIVLFVYIKNRANGIVAFGIFLLLSITTVCSLTYDRSYFGLKIGSLPIYIGNLLAWGLFILYLALNMNALFDILLDYKERRTEKARGKT